MYLRWTIFLFSALLTGAAAAAPGEKDNVVRDIAGRVGPIIGSALACRDVARLHIQVIVDKFAAIITEASSNEAQRSNLTQVLDRDVVDDRGAVTSGRMDCKLADLQPADLEQSIVRPGPNSSAVIAPSFSVYRAASKFTEKTRDLFRGVLYTNISGVGGNPLADDLTLLRPRNASDVIVTQVVPSVSGYPSAVLDYKNALAKHFPGEAPDYASLEGFAAARIPIEGLKRSLPQLDAEKLIDVLDARRNPGPGLGGSLNFGRAEHQASHKIGGTALDETGKYQTIVQMRAFAVRTMEAL